MSRLPSLSTSSSKKEIAEVLAHPEVRASEPENAAEVLASIAQIDATKIVAIVSSVLIAAPTAEDPDNLEVHIFAFGPDDLLLQQIKLLAKVANSA